LEKVIGDFKYEIDENAKALTIEANHDTVFFDQNKGMFYLDLKVDDIYRFEFMIKEAKRKMNLT
jgi:hypothetical protein